MINTLHIKNIGIIDDLCINLNEGLNIITGETGAGKTLIIDSLQILAGGRFSKEMIRSGEKYSFVEMSLYLPNNTEYDEDNIIVSREINMNGKNLCKINGRMVTVNELKEFMKNVIDIHGQNDNQSILDINTHIELLDEFAGNKIKTVKEKYTSLYKKYNEIKLELKSQYGDDLEKQRKLDLLNYQLNEIDAANLNESEEEELENKKTIMMNSEKISECLSIADYSLSEGGTDSISSAMHALDKIDNLDKRYSEIANSLRGLFYEFQEISRDVSELKDDVEFDEEEKSNIEERLDIIHSLKRKYGSTIKEILEYREQTKEEICRIENLEEYNNKLKSELTAITHEMEELAHQMHEIRCTAKETLSKKINNELKDLEMKNAKFDVNVKLVENNKFNKNGLDEVEFVICTNLGEEPKSLIKIASGGEMSRIMLGIKNVLANIDTIPVMVFDEIDTGISGVAANMVGKKMREISKNHQVICITHLASIAAKGDYNYYISKQTQNERTRTSVKVLDEDETIKEIARIASGEITEISLNHARELRKCG